jgi:hypothetical protein
LRLNEPQVPLRNPASNKLVRSGRCCTEPFFSRKRRFADFSKILKKHLVYLSWTPTVLRKRNMDGDLNSMK